MFVKDTDSKVRTHCVCSQKSVAIAGHRVLCHLVCERGFSAFFPAEKGPQKDCKLTLLLLIPQNRLEKGEGIL